LLEGTGKESLRSEGKIKVGLVNKECMEGLKILVFVRVEQATGVLLLIPDIDVLGDSVFLESVAKSMVLE